MNRAAAMDMQRGLEQAEAVKESPHRTQHTVTHSLEGVLGEAAWHRLPGTVRARFGDTAVAVDYVGEFEIVRASLPGRCLARIPLPTWLSPGTTHVEHLDELSGWFRFTMTVTHPLFGELFYQTGRFRAAGG